MRAPQLSDFGLNQEIVEIYETQSTKYSRLKQKIEEENKVYNRNLTFIVVSLVILAFVVFVSVIQQSESPMEVLLCIWGFHTIAMIIVWRCGVDEELGIIAGLFALLVSAVASVCFPFISMGICIYSSFARNEAYMSKMYPKQKYVNTSVEKQVDAYTTAIREYNAWKKKCSIDYWMHMSGYQFEDAIAKLYEKQGYHAEQTSYSSDGGVDIILLKEGQKIAVQCKHHAKPVGPNDVRALMGVVASQNFDKGIFVSLNGFTSTVYNEVERATIPIQLVSLPTILAMVKSGDEDFDECEENTILSKKTSTTPSKENNTSEQRGHTGNEKNSDFCKGQRVYHRSFGVGYIQKLNNDRIIVQFGKGGDEKLFKFPEAFQQRFLSLSPFKTPSKTEHNENLVLRQEKTEKVTKKCMGNCSTCKREYCIEDN